jgi:hypothetical protein
MRRKGGMRPDRRREVELHPTIICVSSPYTFISLVVPFTEVEVVIVD